MSRCGDTRPAGGGPRWGPGLSRSRAQSHWFSPAGRNGAAVSGVPLGTRQGPSETFYQAPRGDAFSSDLASRDDVLRVSGSVLLVDSQGSLRARSPFFLRTHTTANSRDNASSPFASMSRSEVAGLRSTSTTTLVPPALALTTAAYRSSLHFSCARAHCSPTRTSDRALLAAKDWSTAHTRRGALSTRPFRCSSACTSRTLSRGLVLVARYWGVQVVAVRLLCCPVCCPPCKWVWPTLFSH